MSLTAGARVGTYEILGLLGAGGMGEVYRARDVRLGREVALKVLPAEVASSPDHLARFEREARTVAGLNHPNIVTLFSVEDESDLRFLTMELVEGQSVDRLVTHGGLPVDRVLAIASAIADALAAAHQKQVVHRDLKPANVMVTNDGRVKVLDFGLAKLAGTTASTATQAMTAGELLSTPGMVVGTVPYMAPEQLRAEAVDARTDVFALGIMMYELLAGRRPFAGSTPMALGAAILNEAPAPMSSVRSDLPADLEGIVGRCLEKRPEQRFQTASEVSDALRRLRPTSSQAAASPPVSDSVASIAVLPFVNRSHDEEDEYFSDGLADELLNTLTKIPGLRVSARASSFYFKGKTVSPAEVGKALNVAALLDGSVRKAGNRVRISVQLLKASDGYHLWSDTYDRTLDDIFAVQDDIAQSVVKELRTTLLGESRDASPSSRTRTALAAISAERSYDPESYDLYLRGRYLFGASADGPVRAQELFRKAIERSPRFALAYAGLGESYVLQSWLGSRDREMTVSQAKAALAKATELDDQLCEAQVLAGQIKLYFEWDWKGAERDFRRAIEIKPGSDLAHREWGSYLSLTGRFDEGLASACHAQVLDPLSVNATHEVGYQFLILGRLEEASVEFRKAIDLNPTWIWGNIKLGMTYSYMGEHDKAMACVRRADELMGEMIGGPLTRAWLATITLRAGDPERARSALADLEEKSRSEYVDRFAMAWFQFALGDRDAMFACLERGFAARSPSMVFMRQAQHFLWRDIAADPRCEDVIRRMQFP